MVIRQINTNINENQVLIFYFSRSSKWNFVSYVTRHSQFRYRTHEVLYAHALREFLLTFCNLKMLPTINVSLGLLIYFQSVCGLLALSNIVYICALIHYANNRYGNFSSWICSTKNGSNAILIAITRWTIGCLHGTVCFLFTFNIFFQFSTDNYQNDCAAGVNCPLCAFYLPLASSLFGLGVGAEYMLMIRILKDTLTMSKLSLSNTLFKSITTALVTAIVLVTSIGMFATKTQVQATRYNQSIHVCIGKRNVDIWLMILGPVLSAWLTLSGLFILFLFLLKLRQVKQIIVFLCAYTQKHTVVIAAHVQCFGVTFFYHKAIYS